MPPSYPACASNHRRGRFRYNDRPREAYQRNCKVRHTHSRIAGVTHALRRRK
jgi:hypothetical protein